MVQERPMDRIVRCAVMVLLAGCASAHASSPAALVALRDAPVRLGNFSVSLAVKDLAASRAFYEKLGFRKVGGNPAKNWVILQNETATIGLFQGMFDRNTFTFNPGWDRTGSTLPDFDDVRDLQRMLRGRGLVPVTAADEGSKGPASLMLVDPDGNPVLIDQHVPRPGMPVPSPGAGTSVGGGLVGSWRLVEALTVRPNGEATASVLGRSPGGLLVYDPAGNVAVQIGVEEGGSFDRYGAYTGSYAYDPATGMVTHHVRMSLHPAEVGKDLRRKVELLGDRLTLTPEDGRLAGGEMVRTRLVWQRVR
jgi:catechol 2,3-dioxygenase-like lactoylglutathione lyase family enzyme